MSSEEINKLRSSVQDIEKEIVGYDEEIISFSRKLEEYKGKVEEAKAKKFEVCMKLMKEIFSLVSVNSKCEILSYLSMVEILQTAALVCKEWHALTTMEELWVPIVSSFGFDVDVMDGKALEFAKSIRKCILFEGLKADTSKFRTISFDKPPEVQESERALFPKSECLEYSPKHGMTIECWCRLGDVYVSSDTYENPILSKHGHGGGWELRWVKEGYLAMMFTSDEFGHENFNLRYCEKMRGSGDWYNVVVILHPSSIRPGEISKIEYFITGKENGKVRGEVLVWKGREMKDWPYRSSDDEVVNRFGICINPYWTGRYFRGDVDDVRITGRVLKECELMINQKKLDVKKEEFYFKEKSDDSDEDEDSDSDSSDSD